MLACALAHERLAVLAPKVHVSRQRLDRLEPLEHRARPRSLKALPKLLELHLVPQSQAIWRPDGALDKRQEVSPMREAYSCQLAVQTRARLAGGIRAARHVRMKGVETTAWPGRKRASGHGPQMLLRVVQGRRLVGAAGDDRILAEAAAPRGPFGRRRRYRRRSTIRVRAVYS
jgi:hypothetical protein